MQDKECFNKSDDDQLIVSSLTKRFICNCRAVLYSTYFED